MDGGGITVSTDVYVLRVWQGREGGGSERYHHVRRIIFLFFQIQFQIFGECLEGSRVCVREKRGGGLRGVHERCIKGKSPLSRPHTFS